MAKPFDAAANLLVDSAVESWVADLSRRLGRVPGPCEILDTDQSTTLQPDKLIRVLGPEPFLLHLEFESNGRIGRPAELLRYNAIAHVQYDRLPVESVLVLLRPKSNSADLDGCYRVVRPGSVPYLEFRYTVLRVWEHSVADWLAAEPGLAPLAIAARDAADDLPSTATAIWNRLKRTDLPSKIKVELFDASFVLGGLRHESTALAEAFRMLSSILEESTTYQYLVKKGKVQGIAEGKAEEERNLRRAIIRLATKRLGKPGARHLATIKKSDATRLNEVLDRILDAGSWNELVA